MTGIDNNLKMTILLFYPINACSEQKSPKIVKNKIFKESWCQSTYSVRSYSKQILKTLLTVQNKQIFRSYQKANSKIYSSEYLHNIELTGVVRIISTFCNCQKLSTSESPVSSWQSSPIEWNFNDQSSCLSEHNALIGAT